MMMYNGKTLYWTTILVCFFLVLMSGCDNNNVNYTIEMLKQNQNEAVRINLIRNISIVTKGGRLEKLFPFLSKKEEMRGSVHTLLGFLESGSNDVKKETIIALGNLQDKRATKSLIKVVESGNSEQRLYAIEALGKIRDRESVPFLLSLLNELEGRHVILWAIGNIGDPRALESLTPLLSDEDNYVKYNAFKALQMIQKGSLQEIP